MKLLTRAMTLVLVAGSTLAAEFDDYNRSRPNILLILVDDVGYCDVGAFAAPLRKTTTDKLYFETPCMDKLANQGTRFTQFYACTVCSPTRASLRHLSYADGDGRR